MSYKIIIINTSSKWSCVFELHAFAFSKNGIINFFNFMNNFTIQCVNMILQLYNIQNPANIVRVNLESYIPEHLRIIFHYRKKFKSIIQNN